MNGYDIYTIGAGYYLEKVFNAIRLILEGKDNFLFLMQTAAICSLLTLGVKVAIDNDFKAAVKWFLGITVLTGLFLTTRVTIHIHDRLPDSYGRISATRTVENIPWGLAVIGSVTSSVGAKISEKFDMAFSAVFVNSTYHQSGLIFGSKIIEDVSRMRTTDIALKHFMLKFYKQCIVPDVNMGYKRANGYTVRDLAQTDDILNFLKTRASKARMIYFTGDMKVLNKTPIKNQKVDGYVSCNKAANYIADILDYETEMKIPVLASSFLSHFFPEQEGTTSKDDVFRSVLAGSYGMFIRNSSKTAKDLLLQNVMINAINDSVDHAYGKVTTNEMTKSAWYSLAQAAQRYIPIIRAVMECIFYGAFPIILILMLTPNGVSILKNYAWGFVYLQL
jgi:conjugal transfer mating pair stabilization protein TraG